MANRRLFIVFLIYFTLLFINHTVTETFAQGKEYLRDRVGSLAAEEGPVPGGGVATVEYFIAPEDEMEVFVWQNSDVTKNIIVGPDGWISYPLVGRIKVVGLSIGQLEEKIREALSKYIKFPHVSIMMRKFSGYKIIVLGEVNYPGIYTYKGTINLIEAMALAGYFTPDARQDSVMVVRGNLTEHPSVKRINMKRVIRKGTSSPEIILSPNDVIYVPKAFISDFNKFLTNINPTLDSAASYLDFRNTIRILDNYKK